VPGGKYALPVTPLVSVVVPTHDRPGRLAALLAALRAQTLAQGDFEVIIVDDGSGPETAALLDSEGDRESGAGGVRRLRREHAGGPGTARNLGWREARAPLIAFTDDDCCPGPEWLAAGLRAHLASPRGLIQGRTEPNPDELDRLGVFSRTVSVPGPGPQYETCNIFYPRELLERLGGFDEAFDARLGGEDAELGWRALEAGRPTGFAHDALVFHAVHRLGALGMLRQANRWSGTARVVARHPGARVMLNRGVFWNGWHYCLIRSLVALALPSPVRRFLLTRHAMQLADRAQEAGAGAWAIPFLLLYDMAELWAVARGGVRYRTLVL
jgi:hypothetical protein